MQFGGASHEPRATQGHEAAFLDMLKPETLEHGDPVVHGIFVVPLVTQAVYEDGDVGQSVITIDNITSTRQYRFVLVFTWCCTLRTAWLPCPYFWAP
jgi:hypothetical protein